MSFPWNEYEVTRTGKFKQFYQDYLFFSPVIPWVLNDTTQFGLPCADSLNKYWDTPSWD